ncbi:MAG: hypothetical protein LIP09_09795 [Bacteroidales bacterium]|nr:hypothetical protein [Bacteroidales bacterium]
MKLTTILSATIMALATLVPTTTNADTSLKQDGFELVINIEEDQTLFIDSLICDSDPLRRNLLVNADGLGYYPNEATHRINADFIDWKSVVPGEKYTLTLHRADEDMHEYKLTTVLAYNILTIGSVITKDFDTNYELTLPENNNSMLVYWGEPQDRVSHIYYKEYKGQLVHERYQWKGKPIFGSLHTCAVDGNSIDHLYATPGLHTITILTTL